MSHCQQGYTVFQKINFSLFIFTLLVLFSAFVSLASANDFLTFWNLGEIVNGKGSPSSISSLTGMYVFYLPAFSYLFALFTHLPIWLIWSVWNLLKAAGLACFLNQILDFKSRTNIKYIVALCFVLTLGFYDADFKLGQFNLLVFICTFFAIYFLNKNKILLSAFLYQFACLKLTPLIFLPYLIYKTKGRILLPLTFIIGVYYFLGAFLYSSFLAPYQHLKEWATLSFGQKIQNKDTGFLQNQSLLGLLERDFASLSYQAKHLIWLSVAILLTIFTFHLLLKTKKLTPSVAGLIFLQMLILSPDTRGPHLVALLLPLICISIKLDFRQNLFFYLESTLPVGEWNKKQDHFCSQVILFATECPSIFFLSSWILSFLLAQD
jgi:hypothetical protein